MCVCLSVCACACVCMPLCAREAAFTGKGAVVDEVGDAVDVVRVDVGEEIEVLIRFWIQMIHQTPIGHRGTRTQDCLQKRARIDKEKTS